ncbi:MAG: transketolase [Acidobacteria bacterium]|nr:transketolase [Acidobacteriota bacterium]
MTQNIPASPSTADLDLLCVNTIRFLSVDAIQKAESGHPGLPLGAAPMAYTLWSRFLKHNPSNPGWWDRDRFVLSAGHGSMLLYSLLYLTGYDLPLSQIRQFRQLGSRTPGHPERGLVPGVEITTGPLGQGMANGVGMAAAEAFLAARYNRPGYEIINHCTYAIISDGDVMEGIGYEAASLAGHLKLGKLIYLYDDNRICLAGATDLSFSEDRAGRFRALGWHTITVEDGNDMDAVDGAIRAAKAETERPSMILVRTKIGYGSPKQDSADSHGAPLGVEEARWTKKNLGWPEEPPFYVPEEALNHCRRAVDRGRKAELEWNSMLADYAAKYPDLAREFEQAMRAELLQGWDEGLPSFPPDPKGIATRAASGRVLNALGPRLPMLIGGSADLNPSTKSVIKTGGDFQNPGHRPGDTQGSTGGEWGYRGSNLHFGVREHAMGGIANGMAAHGGIIPYTATFFVFADYMRPPIRLAALMELGTIFLFTHDSIGVGEDGPTHQPVEHLAALRCIPNLTVLRPCDANETVAAWRVAVQSRNKPVALVLTRQSVPVLDRSRFAPADGLERGAYILADAPSGLPELILMASGSEVGLIVEAGKALEKEGIAARIVSMPSWELFDAQPQEYRDAVLPPGIRARLAVEAGVAQGWRKYVGDSGDIIGMKSFGESAPAKDLFKKYGFTAENVVACAKKLAGARA